MSLKIVATLVTFITLVFSAIALATNASNDEIVERIKQVGDVYLVAAEPEVEEKRTEPWDGKTVYDTYCTACHSTGVSESPIKGNAEQWAPRIAQGMDVLTDHAVKGFNAMPAMGTCMDCSQDEIVAAINYMIEGL